VPSHRWLNARSILKMRTLECHIDISGEEVKSGACQNDYKMLYWKFHGLSMLLPHFEEKTCRRIAPACSPAAKPPSDVRQSGALYGWCRRPGLVSRSTQAQPKGRTCLDFILRLCSSNFSSSFLTTSLNLSSPHILLKTYILARA
jgi:hypothetical protein